MNPLVVKGLRKAFMCWLVVKEIIGKNELGSIIQLLFSLLPPDDSVSVSFCYIMGIIAPAIDEVKQNVY